MDIAIMFDDGSDALLHYGVKGMRWGFRRDRRGSAASRLRNKSSNSASRFKTASRLRKNVNKAEIAKIAVGTGSAILLSGLSGAAASAIAGMTISSAAGTATASLGSAAISNVLGVGIRAGSMLASQPIKDKMATYIDEKMGK